MAIENDYQFTIQQVHLLKIPDGYQVEHIPQNVSVSNQLIDFTLEYKKVNNQVVATQNYVLKKLYIQPVDFTLWNKTITTLAPAYKEEIVFKKK